MITLTRLAHFLPAICYRAPVANLLTRRIPFPILPFPSLKPHVWTYLQGSRPFSGGWPSVHEFAGKSNVDKIHIAIAKIPAAQDLERTLKNLQGCKYDSVKLTCPKGSLHGQVDWLKYCLTAIVEGKSSSEVKIHITDGHSTEDLDLTDTKLVAIQICELNSSFDVTIT